MRFNKKPIPDNRAPMEKKSDDEVFDSITQKDYSKHIKKLSVSIGTQKNFGELKAEANIECDIDDENIFDLFDYSWSIVKDQVIKQVLIYNKKKQEQGK